jgi:hypothetical protein
MSEDTERGPSVLLSCKSLPLLILYHYIPSPISDNDRVLIYSVAGGGIGGIVASVSFRQQDRASGYIPGLWTTVAAQMVIVITATLLMLYFKRQNKLADSGAKILQGHLGRSIYQLSVPCWS